PILVGHAIRHGGAGAAGAREPVAADRVGKYRYAGDVRGASLPHVFARVEAIGRYIGVGCAGRRSEAIFLGILAELLVSPGGPLSSAAGYRQAEQHQRGYAAENIAERKDDNQRHGSTRPT